MRRLVSFLLAPLVLVACSSSSEVSSDGNPGITAGAGGQPNDASVGGTGGGAGSPGTGGDAGTAGSSSGGAAGNADGGAGGQAGASGGSAGASGHAGAAGSGVGGSSGSGTGGTGANGGTGGTGATGGTGGTGGVDGGAPLPCSTDADCSGGTSCQIVPDDTSTALELRCMPLAGSNGKGIACTAASDCRSGLCLHGFCSVTCDSAGDCTQAGTCRTETITIGGLADDFPVCAILPCTSDAQCDPGEVCSDIRSYSGVMAAYCRQANATGAPVGTACTAASECTSGLCPSWLEFCTAACASDSDCTASTGLGCVDVYNDGTTIVQGCAVLCTHEADCPVPSHCSFGVDTTGNRHRFICAPGNGNDPVGADCSTVNHCASGLCLSNYVNGQLVDKICTAPCSNGATDCPAGYQSCDEVLMKTPDGNGTETVGLCNHP